MARLKLLLPSLRACHAQWPQLARWQRLGDRLTDVEGGRRAVLREHFHWAGGAPLPAAAFMRQAAAGDAGDDAWLCVEPAWVQADINGARMLVCGDLDLTPQQGEALAHALKPLFGDSGLLLEITTPAQWQARLAPGAQVPDFAWPAQVLGDNLFAHLPQGAPGRRWRALWNDAQVLLHQHPVNAERKAQGKAPANSLWLWGGGALPSAVHSELDAVVSDDPLLLAMANAARVAVHARADPMPEGDILLDLGLSAPQDVPGSMFDPLEGHLRARRWSEIVLCFSSGERWRMRRWHRWRFWRRG